MAAARGRRWVLDGFRILRRAPIPLMVITMIYLVVLVAGAALPAVGAFAPLLLAPALSVGLMHAMRAAENGQQPAPSLLFRGLRDAGGTAWRPLLVLGLINAMSTVIALGVSALIDDGLLFEIATGQVRNDDTRLADAPLPLSACAFLLMYTPVQMALWYAPLFAAWHGQ